MSEQVLSTIISTAGAVLVGLGGMWISTHQLGKRMDYIAARLLSLESKVDHRFDLLMEKFY
jgi:formylmethanofuran dehydrogenase subunit E